MAKKHGATIFYRPVPLGRLFPETGGLPLFKRHPARQAYRMIELQRWRVKKNLKLGLRTKLWHFDPSLADRIVALPAGQGAAVEACIPRTFAAVFAEEQNLADESFVAALLAQAGFDSGTVIAEAKGERAIAAYDANLAQALASGVFGAPSYVLAGEIFWGQDRRACLDKALANERALYHADA